jgi:hypothetical protein
MTREENVKKILCCTAVLIKFVREGNTTTAKRAEALGIASQAIVDYVKTFDSGCSDVPAINDTPLVLGSSEAINDCIGRLVPIAACVIPQALVDTWAAKANAVLGI